MSRSIHGGRHELGQNHLHDPATLATITDLVRQTRGPILEIGAGSGALTRPLARLGRPLAAVDIDEHRVTRLRHELPDIALITADILQVRLDPQHRVVVGNVPFHLTTPILRKLLGGEHWRETILLVQWEVARKRAGVGGATMMTAQSAPWYEFELCGRVPARAFRPMPSVDGGILRIRRREVPLVPATNRRAYEALIKAVYTGRGRGVGQILGYVAGISNRHRQVWLDRTGVDRSALPRDVPPAAWSDLWSLVSG